VVANSLTRRRWKKGGCCEECSRPCKSREVHDTTAMTVKCCGGGGVNKLGGGPSPTGRVSEMWRFGRKSCPSSVCASDDAPMGVVFVL
jgi:hypothetical protein